MPEGPKKSKHALRRERRQNGTVAPGSGEHAKKKSHHARYVENLTHELNCDGGEKQVRRRIVNLIDGQDHHPDGGPVKMSTSQFSAAIDRMARHVVLKQSVIRPCPECRGTKWHHGNCRLRHSYALSHVGETISCVEKIESSKINDARALTSLREQAVGSIQV